METIKIIKDLVKEVFLKNNNLPEESLEYIFLESVRVTSLQEMKVDLKRAIYSTLIRKVRNLRVDNDRYPFYREPIVDLDALACKTMILIHEKIAMSGANSDGKNGEFLYEDYPFIQVGKDSFAEIFLEKAKG